MKKTIVFIFCSIFYTSYAQHSADSFAIYKQTVPGSSFSFTMVPIPGGSFLLGSPATENGREPGEGPQRKLGISPFWMCAYEVTRDEFDVFLNDASTSLNAEVDAITRPSPQYIDFSQGMGKEGGFPANSMSQYSALMYCRWLYKKTGIFYRLPTEAEWEYACRAGTTTTYYFGNDASQLDRYAWYAGNSQEKFQKVGQKLPNAWGLYDMLGNMLEWTLDHYTEDRYAAITDDTKDPMPPANESRYPKVLRGGSYAEIAVDLRAAKRFKSIPAWNRRDPQIPKSKWWLTEAAWAGFRVIRPLQQPSAEKAEAFFAAYLGR